MSRHETTPPVSTTIHLRPVEEPSLETDSAAATQAVARILGDRCAGGEVMGLVGMLGSGKTCFVKGLAEGLGVASEKVSSPTFALIHEYEGRLPLCHVDLYRLNALDALHGLGLEEYTESGGITVIEWADKAPAVLPSHHLLIRFEPLEGDRRRLAFSPHGSRYELLVAELLARWAGHRMDPR